MHGKTICLPLAFSACLGLVPATFGAGTQVQIVLPLGRTAYQTNETIDVSVVRSVGADALAAGDLVLSVAGDNGSKMAFTFPVAAVTREKTEARSTEHLHLNGRLLRPGKYTIGVAADGATATAPIEVVSHVRRTDFKLLQWGSRAEKHEQAIVGEDSMGYNLIYTSYGGLSPDEMIRGGSDFMWCCTMSGAHQMDLRQECDWSDPYVLQGGEARVVRRALMDRTLPNCMGVHFYDEPGLSWWRDPKTGTMVPFNLPPQDRSYQSAFGAQPPRYNEVKPGDAAAVAKWNEMGRWKESFMEAAWKYARHGIERVRPDFLSVTQSQYGWMAYTDGYYFNVARALSVISGHGGYDDGPATIYYPSFTHEMGRIRDLNKPIWYLPTWYGEGSDDLRLEQYLSFMMNLQGMATPPDFTVQKPQSTESSEGVVESNKLMARLGTIFTTMRVTRPQVAMLYSMSQNLAAQVQDMQDLKRINDAAYEGGGHTRAKLLDVYLAGKMIHIGIFPLVEEDVVDGTLAANHKVIILPGVNALEPKVIAALEQYIDGGGVVLLTDDSQVHIKGAQKLGAAADTTIYDKLSPLWITDQKESMRLRRPEHYFQQVEPLAAALKAKLTALGITPDFDADSPHVVTSRQAQGDVEYLFAVNATPNPDNDKTKTKATTATLMLAADGRPIYDAVHSAVASEFQPKGQQLAGKLRFGPGAMRVFARTTRPIHGVQVQTPVVFKDFTLADAPLRVELSAAVVDDQKSVLSGSIPLRIWVIDPLGQVRYDLYRATDRGTIRLSLPLAANDPAGKWQVAVEELLSGTESSAHFTYQPAPQCGALAGATPRAVYFGDDTQHVFDLFRNHQDVTVVTGTGEYNAAAAERLATAIKPWGIHCNIVTGAEANKPRHISPEEAATWCGLDAGRIEPGDKNSPASVGFALRGPAILIGTPEDNPLIKFVADAHMLAYKADAATLPGRGRGYLAWQRDAVGYGQESVTLIAYDAAGMAEAVGTMYEAVAGLDPLTRWTPASAAPIAPASKSTAPPEARIAWQTLVPDRVVSLSADANGMRAFSEDGSVTELDATGKITKQGLGDAPAAGAGPKVPEAMSKSLVSGRIVKYVASSGPLTAIGYWGGTVQVLDASGATQSLQVLPADVGGLAWVEGKLVVGLSDGSVLALKTK